ncbi:CoA-binding protein [Oxalobacter vibrioformis]|uniref:CoA-binding protein n=1 Tax=Oxalobacter vibrioformis TaxID=933080 RepID=A0A9E9LZ17_9BURK|nr:CoA-binding protein [Oxalobacter vibrioformis]NLC24047.1 CoA-binding protein [Oxalobacter sp.]WAW10285.1 CoA-binding protein [Oxalobacter vibrioformis]
MIIDDDVGIREIFQTIKTVAVVGCSPNAGPKNYVPSYVKEEGYRIIPVNPLYDEVLGEKCYPSLKDIPEKVDMVECFRPSGDIPLIAEDAIAIGARVLWMQQGIINDEAAKRASEAGLKVVMDRCPCAEIPRLIPGREMSWRDFKAKFNPKTNG